MAASVVTKLNMVHIFGWIMPEPLHIPPMVTVVPFMSICTATCLFFVSVVIMAFAASVPFSGLLPKSGAIAFTPAAILSIGSCFPITPVDATRTPSSDTPSACAAAFAVCAQYPIPSSPVQAFAIPALTMITWASAPLVTWFLSHFTGAAFTRLIVKVPALLQGFLL